MRRAAALAIVAMLFAACGGGDDKDADTVASSTSSTTGSSVVGETTTTVPTGGGATTTTKAGGSATTIGTNSSTIATGAPLPAKPGTYEYRQSGTSSLGSVPAMGTLKIDAAGPGGVQIWHEADDPQSPPTDFYYAFRSDGPFITRTIVRQAGQSIDCTFNPPIAAPPWPHTVGKKITGHAVCGPVTVDVTGSITGTRKATVDGKSIDVIVATTTLKTSGQVVSTSNTVEWWAPSLRLLVHAEVKTTGTFGAFAFQSNVTRDLVSGVPK